MKRGSKSQATSISPVHPIDPDPALQRHIAERAYQIFQVRGAAHGNDVDDWLRAEREVVAAWGRKRMGRTTTSARPRTRTPKAA